MPASSSKVLPRVFVASLIHETSSFSPIPTSAASFRSFEYHRPAGGVVDERCRGLSGYGGFVRAAEAAGHAVYASTYASAQPSGRCSREGYDELREEILGDLRREGPFDMVLLFLHGAQMAEGCDDCEGDLLARVRDIVGAEVFVGALLDLHANVSARMLESATVLAACRHYPHVDFDERAAHILRVGETCVVGGARAVVHYRRVPILGMFYTTEPRMAQVNAAALELQELPGVLSVSLIHGFPWTDSPDLGAGVLLVSDGPRPQANDEIDTLARAFFDARDETRALRAGIDALLDEVERAAPDPQRRPFVIADACDNAGGGAGSDSTFLLDALLRRGLRGYALGLLWDPIAAAFAVDAGVGATLALRLGGKAGPLSGRPLDVQARVLALRPDGKQSGLGFHVPLGAMAALEIAGNVVVVNSVRTQVFSPSCFTDLGIDLQAMKALVVKSSQHFRAQFEPLVRAVRYCETPSYLPLDMRNLPYTKLQRPMWPLDDVTPA
jgi:microcystin degradation protein MlrC